MEMESADMIIADQFEPGRQLDPKGQEVRYLSVTQ